MNKTGLDLMAEERRRQIEVEGWTAEHDRKFVHDELALAAAGYAINGIFRKVDGGPQLEFFVSSYIRDGISVWNRDEFPFWPKWDKRGKHDRKRSLIIAGALIAAELDRMMQAETEETK